MANETNPTNEQTTTDAPKAKPKAKRTNGGKRYTVSALAIERAKAKNIPVDRAAKEIRGRLRSNWADVIKADPSILKVKSAHNDGNRWPAVNEKVRAIALGKK